MCILLVNFKLNEYQSFNQSIKYVQSILCDVITYYTVKLWSKPMNDMDCNPHTASIAYTGTIFVLFLGGHVTFISSIGGSTSEDYSEAHLSLIDWIVRRFQRLLPCNALCNIWLRLWQVISCIIIIIIIIVLFGKYWITYSSRSEWFKWPAVKTAKFSTRWPPTVKINLLISRQRKIYNISNKKSWRVHF